MTPDLVTLQSALADAFHDCWVHLARHLEDRPIRKSDWWEDLVDGYSFDDLATAFQSPAVTGPTSSTFKSGAAAVQATLGVRWNVPDAVALSWARQRGAEMVGRRLVNGRLVDNPSAQWSVLPATRTGIKALLTHHLSTGGSWKDLEEDVSRLPGFSGVLGSYRAEVVARTEVALAANAGFVGACDRAGVTKVRVVDNPNCPICRPVDGTVQTLDWARDNSIGHPNCTRSFRAVVT